VLTVPELALSALDRELRRQGDFAARAVAAALAQPVPDRGALALARVVTTRLQRAIGDFVSQLTRSGLSERTAGQAPRLLRIARYYDEAAAAASVAVTTAGQSGDRPPLPSLDVLRRAAGQVLAVANPALGLASVPDIDRAAEAFERAYQAAKADLLDAGARTELPVADMDGWLRTLSALRRAVEQLVKAGRMLGPDSAPAVIANVLPASP
ncbi:MAG TPA: Na/Pi cotransporter family protein, partial [Gammaproteobacteria bacterium]|nr:Na/Pi cotransporter family protein [Gammaproteobacteria bacterium]